MSTNEEIARAAEILKAGGLVAFPTETVYGLGANALDAVAVEKIFAAKGRPKTSPLIVHVAEIAQAKALVRAWPMRAQKLAEAFWPGPLTLVLPKKAGVPGVVTAGRGTVGIRIPDHPIALALLRAAQMPLAAPSANPFSRVSPTTAQHVREHLGDRVDLVLDGGPSQVGIESTVVAVDVDGLVLLRPGQITRAELDQVAGPVREEEKDESEAGHASPGMAALHYSPKTRLVIAKTAAELPQGRGVVLAQDRVSAAGSQVIAMPRGWREYGAALYEALHTADASGAEWIGVMAPPEGSEWEAVWDRLRRAVGTGL